MYSSVVRELQDASPVHVYLVTSALKIAIQLMALLAKVGPTMNRKHERQANQ